MKVSVPKEEIEKIMADYSCTAEEAAKAYLDAKEKSKEAFSYSLSENLKSRKSNAEHTAPKIFTPNEIKNHLDQYVIGQEEYKKRLAVAAAYHFAMVKYLNEHPEEASVKRFRKKNTITAGPSGSGKTYSVEILGDLLQVPTLIIDSTDYTEAGYVGKSADDMIRELIDLAPGNSRQEQTRFINHYGGLIFIDEIDKKAKEAGGIGHDISREGFQRSVLKLVERKLVPINNPLSPMAQIQEMMNRRSGRTPEQGASMVSTGNILFILGGSFDRAQDNLESIVKKRIHHKGRIRDDGSVAIVGFAADGRHDAQKPLENYYKNAESDDYIKFGLIPELVGRSPIRTYVNLLSKNDLVRIMLDTQDSILDQYRLEFKLFDIEIEFTAEAIEYVAEKAENRKTGARALINTWESILTDFQFELPGSNFSVLKVDRDLCERPNECLLKILKRSPYVSFVEHFEKEYGIEVVLEEDLQDFIETYAAQKGLQVSDVLRKLSFSASALNYMGLKSSFMITRQMVEDETYFDRLFARWYDSQTN